MSTLIVTVFSHSSAHFLRMQGDGQIVEVAALNCPRSKQSMRDFAGRIARWLDDARELKAYHRLVLIASPNMLALLRKFLSTESLDLIAEEYAQQRNSRGLNGVQWGRSTVSRVASKEMEKCQKS